MAIGVDKYEMIEYINQYNHNDVFTINDITLIYLKQEDDEHGPAYKHYEVECKVDWIDPQTPKYTTALRKCLVDASEYKSYIERKYSIKWL
jgi:hypothetical protein